MPTPLLNDDGTASMATNLMSSHHALRRDLACFVKALAAGTTATLGAAWTRFRNALHGHHTVEDNGLFPDLRAKHPELGTAIDTLDAHHRAIDPLLDRGDTLFADLPAQTAAARELVRELGRLLDEHLEAEELAVIPHLRGAKEFPPMPDEMLAMYADGFAWSTRGLAESVYEKILETLPAGLVARLSAARLAFDAQCREVWGYAHTGSSTTSVPST